MKTTTVKLHAATALALLLAACQSKEGAAPASQTAAAALPVLDRLVNAAAEPHNWLTHGGTYQEQRFSTLDQINTDTVGQLGLAWFHDLDTTRGQEATPLVVDGVMYTTTAWSKVVALDAATGRMLWTHDPEVPGETGPKACCDVVNRGAAYDKGRVFVGTLDGRLIALDAKSGKLLWSTMTVDASKPYTITGAPRVVKGKVIIGNGGAELGVRGYVSAYDAETGALAWRFYTVPGEAGKPDNAASDEAFARFAGDSWHGDAYVRYGGGGTVWDSIVYDAELDQLYIGTGNGSPWNREYRSEDKGDNLFLSSIVALDPDSGRYLWHYQQVPGETWDFTATQQITLADLTIDGAPRKVLMHAPKNGFFYVIDRRDGKLISAEKFVPVNWAERIDKVTGRPVEHPDARYRNKPFLANSGASGAHNWHPMAYSPQTGLVYIPAQQVPFLYVRDGKFRYQPGLWNLGVDMLSTPVPTKADDIAAMKQALQGRLIAWDPVAQKEVWRVTHDQTWNGGLLATAGNLVFQGVADGSFRAYRATDGKALWSFATQSVPLPGAISYKVGDTQYIAVMVGHGGGFPLTLPAFEGPRAVPPGRVMAFKLGGRVELPPLDPTIAALNVPKERWAETEIKAGAQHYAGLCAGCHGMATLSAGIVPDLKRSVALTDRKLWSDIVIGGALTSRGMVSFSNHLSPAQAEAIRAYVGTEAKKAK